jgi:hypothetical protein
VTLCHPSGSPLSHSSSIIFKSSKPSRIITKSHAYGFLEVLFATNKLQFLPSPFIAQNRPLPISFQVTIFLTNPSEIT